VYDSGRKAACFIVRPLFLIDSGSEAVGLDLIPPGNKDFSSRGR